jgi:hypothetical protein
VRLAILHGDNNKAERKETMLPAALKSFPKIIVDNQKAICYYLNMIKFERMEYLMAFGFIFPDYNQFLFDF